MNPKQRSALESNQLSNQGRSKRIFYQGLSITHLSCLCDHNFCAAVPVPRFICRFICVPNFICTSMSWSNDGTPFRRVYQHAPCLPEHRGWQDDSKFSTKADRASFICNVDPFFPPFSEVAWTSSKARSLRLKNFVPCWTKNRTRYKRSFFRGCKLPWWHGPCRIWGLYILYIKGSRIGKWFLKL